VKQVARGRRHQIPKRVCAQVDVAVEQVQQEHEDDRPLPREIRRQAEEHGLLAEMGQGFHWRNQAGFGEQRADCEPEQPADEGGQQPEHPGGPVGHRAELLTRQFLQGAGFQRVGIDQGEQQQPAIKFQQHQRKAQAGEQQHPAPEFAPKRHRKNHQIQMRRPLQRRAKVPIKEGADEKKTEQNRGRPPGGNRFAGRAFQDAEQCVGRA